ncbi:glutamate receptor-interacting protein 1-like isoform X2 [Chrysoperla carnea]|uniref:glutamate receptor-interacting protein 1-like isoform X2 n=1 Tax=Chrysoperla carnea TaxID=189513 RepID=UPI001D0872BE|nr:glutamate receptor-interacting protein 1-like isoform X2 [Chrysoperla carnea]
MFSSFKLPSLRSKKHNDKSENGTPTGTPISKRHQRRISDAGGCPSIASLRPGSIAYNSDQLMSGDKIHSVNGITTSHSKPEDVAAMLNNVEDRALLEVEYSLPDCVSQNSLSTITSKVTNITVEREDGSLGITLRGGVHGDPQLTRALVITHVRPNGPAHKTGLIKVGDRLLKVDNQTLTNKTLMEAQKILTQTNDNLAQTPNPISTLTIEYDVSIMETVKYATGPLLVEIERHIHEELGIGLGNKIFSDNENVIYIESIMPASIADRCGALHINDQILAIDDIRLEGTNLSAEEVMTLFENSKGSVTRLHILPFHTYTTSIHSHRSASGLWNQSPKELVPGTPSMSGFSTINSRRSRFPFKKTYNFRNPQKVSNLEGNNYCGYHPQLGVCHRETLNVTLCSEGNGFGLSVGTELAPGEEEASIVVTDIETNSVADRCGCLQIGDRLLSINCQPNLTLQEINTIFERGYDPKLMAKLELQVEIDVVDSIIPSSGVFTVKIARQTTGLGITITASKNNPNDPFIISDIRRGSIAHRIGTLHVGDRLLAIDNQNLDHQSLETAFEILQSNHNEIVTLQVEKVPRDTSYLLSENIVYTVELVRYGGPLGITISGSEDCLEPIILSRLIEGGLAEKTGALHVGDRILAINGENLINRPLSDAIRLLQCSGDRVQLKISRQIKARTPCEENRESFLVQSPGSIDSAVESWVGSMLIENNYKNEKESSQKAPEDSETKTEAKETESKPINENKSENNHKDSMQNLQYYSDTDDVMYAPSPLPLPLPNYNYRSNNNTINSDLFASMQLGESFNSTILNNISPTVRKRFEYNEIQHESPTQIGATSRSPPGPSSANIQNSEFNINNNRFDSINADVYHVILYKDAVYDDYGFSVSDGLYEKGVYINRIRKGGPADIVGLLKPFDRILQVNDTKTQDFDCCLTVPLIASAGDRMELVIARSNNNLENKVVSWITEEHNPFPTSPTFSSLSGSQSTITKTL